MPSHDTAQRRRAKRSGRETGCWAYIPAEVLAEIGWKAGDPVFYRTRPDARRNRVLVTLYREA